MKTFKYIVINKNDMTQMKHFATAEMVVDHLNGRKINNVLVIVNEKTVVNLGDLGVVSVSQIQKILEEIV